MKLEIIKDRYSVPKTKQASCYPVEDLNIVLSMGHYYEVLLTGDKLVAGSQI